MIRYDLQFFAKDGPGGQKTEPASAKKLNDARKKGQVAKSKDFTGAVMLLASFLILKFYIASMGRQFIDVFKESYARITDFTGGSLETYNVFNYAVTIMNNSLVKILLMLLPFLAVSFLLAFILDLVQVKWKVSSEPLKPKFDKFNPVNGVKRLFNVKTLVNLLKQVAIVAICGIVAYNKIKKQIMLLFNLYDMTMMDSIRNMGSIVMDIGITISIIYLVVGVGDLVFEKWKFKDDMKMTKQEVKDEWKDTEGSPDVKSKQRRRMQEASRRRMMQAVPEADVVITNPTHFAVALKYEPDSGKAPVVVAKGEDYLALKIKEKAKESDVEIVENKLLARMIYYNVELGAEIPQELYQAVAEVLAFVWKLKNKI